VCWSSSSKERETRIQANSRSVITRPHRDEYGFDAGHFDGTHDDAALEDERLRTATPHELLFDRSSKRWSGYGKKVWR
jgi:hypothetical protein